MEPHWELKDAPDIALFFRHLHAVFPTANALFVEGISLARDVNDFLRSAAQPGGYLPGRQTLWPRSNVYRLRFDDPTLWALGDLSRRHAEPELLDHLFVYEGSNALLEYPDAFGQDCPALISADADEQRVQDFAAVLGLKLTRH